MTNYQYPPAGAPAYPQAPAGAPQAPAAYPQAPAYPQAAPVPQYPPQGYAPQGYPAHIGHGPAPQGLPQPAPTMAPMIQFDGTEKSSAGFPRFEGGFDGIVEIVSSEAAYVDVGKGQKAHKFFANLKVLTLNAPDALPTQVGDIRSVSFDFGKAPAKNRCYEMLLSAHGIMAGTAEEGQFRAVMNEVLTAASARGSQSLAGRRFHINTKKMVPTEPGKNPFLAIRSTAIQG